MIQLHMASAKHEVTAEVVLTGRREEPLNPKQIRLQKSEKAGEKEQNKNKKNNQTIPVSC